VHLVIASAPCLVLRLHFVVQLQLLRLMLRLLRLMLRLLLVLFLQHHRERSKRKLTR
jgi:hypothetical protein